MPYIREKFRTNIKEKIANLMHPEKVETPGLLNYVITNILINYLNINGESYQTYNDIIGALECAKLEIYRRKISTYENKAIERNGDVY